MGLIWPKLIAPTVATGIEFVGGTIETKLGATSGDTTTALNSGLTGGIASAVSDDDMVIAVFATGSSSDRTLAITDGTNPYTLIGSELYQNDTYDTNLRVCYKFVSGDTSTTFGPTGSNVEAGAMAVYVFRGVDQTTPLDVTVTTAQAANTVLANPPAITPSTPGAFIVCIGAGAHGMGDAQTFSSSDLTDFFSDGQDETGTSNRHITLGIGHKPDWVSGAFDAAAFTFSESDNAAFSWAAMSIALRPA